MGSMTIASKTWNRRKKRVRYVPPMDDRELHMTGMNYCGPGTNVRLRRKMGIKPVDRLDEGALEHDLVTEPRGPYTSNGDAKKLRDADRKFRNHALRLLATGYTPKWKAVAVVTAMDALLRTGARGRRIK